MAGSIEIKFGLKSQIKFSPTVSCGSRSQLAITVKILIITSYSAGIDFSRQNLTSVDVRL